MFKQLQWAAACAEIKASSTESPELSKLPSFKSGVGLNIDLHASPTDRV